MRVAYVSANRECLPDPVVPLGLLHVMAATPSEHEKHLIDLCFESEPQTFLARRLAEIKPDLVAIGMRNIQNADYSGTSDVLNYYDSLFQTIRATTRAPIIIGGGGFSVIPQALMRRFKPDFGISGEGETAFQAFIAAFASGSGDYGGVGNLHYFKDGQLISNLANSAYVDLGQPLKLDRSQVDSRYYSLVGTENLQTKRGCALHCEYCTYPIIEGRKVRQRDPAQIVDDLFEALERNPNIKHFFIVDSVFNIPPKHAKEICREMIRRGFSTPWTCYANPIGFDRELAELMKAASCAGMEIGSDSGCDDILKSLKKGFDTKRIRAMSQLCREVGLRDCHTFILGTPAETLEHVQRSLEFITDLDPYAAILMAYKDDRESVDAGLAASRSVFRNQVLDVLKTQQEKFPHWIIPSLGTNFDARMFRLLRKRGYRGPLWQYSRVLAPNGKPSATPMTLVETAAFS